MALNAHRLDTTAAALVSIATALVLVISTFYLDTQQQLIFLVAVIGPVLAISARVGGGLAEPKGRAVMSAILAAMTVSAILGLRNYVDIEAFRANPPSLNEFELRVRGTWAADPSLALAAIATVLAAALISLKWRRG